MATGDRRSTAKVRTAPDGFRGKGHDATLSGMATVFAELTTMGLSRLHRKVNLLVSREQLRSICRGTRRRGAEEALRAHVELLPEMFGAKPEVIEAEYERRLMLYLRVYDPVEHARRMEDGARLKAELEAQAAKRLVHQRPKGNALDLGLQFNGAGGSTYKPSVEALRAVDKEAEERLQRIRNFLKPA